ncbi:MAG: pentapeptide repeat-containing protein [Oscillatoria sp. PMC 1051.18]|uniref:pentapeptide repeat-containing protein n=1 Tax=Oscillatoria salina TaxID=331517 RepID=UPI0013BCD483|nr:pentapeptide repeat-containing protein [Oscillatoria salina]MBZ8178973.1 pentapeptide repeat-containing protein [Oscillatoria salina IIICB1]MEC4893209.1 pentapeptide repeat-containing protein [Oscillatoria sp. PMC 1050.18]MEC5029987.1 pentapeptide repeat-containing protein [Oscillatoria sp. PMC 1051.18]NET88178.1 pentapeptide repeat-containing protein [Kamptonema sp. SIO1D9]
MNVTELGGKYAAGVRDFANVNLSEANLSGINLSGANLSEANLNVVNLSGANLSGANLERAKLNVARLSGINLSRAKLNQAVLNVANLIRADLGEAELIEAALIRAELIRAELSGANLRNANLNGVDLREATLRYANLSGCNLSEANLRGAFLTSAILEGATMNGANLCRCDLSAANLREAELRQVDLSRADLNGADLRGANLRWADLSGASLRWADLSEAKLSGASLIGADLTNANLLNASLVHANLTQARLIKADWVGADLTGATLTGAKLYAVSRFGLKTEGMTCEWVDLSPEGDRSEIYHFTSERAKKFFNETLPTVEILIDAPLDFHAHVAIASIYQQIVSLYPGIKRPPTIEVSSRRTAITFSVDSNDRLFTTAYLAVIPFADAQASHRNLIALVHTLQSQDRNVLSLRKYQRIKQISISLNRAIAKLNQFELPNLDRLPAESANFFQAPTQTVLTNSNDQTLEIYRRPVFGKRLMQQSNLYHRAKKTSQSRSSEATLPSVKTAIEFIRELDEPEQVNQG